MKKYYPRWYRKFSLRLQVKRFDIFNGFQILHKRFFCSRRKL